MHVEDFASRLRALKERSGRSYGQLAARLHVSTSTLHRYCNGQAVPGEFAPVERFARVCGAGPEELLALHRAWLLADAERRGEPSGGAGATLGDASVPEAAAAETAVVGRVVSPVLGPARSVVGGLVGAGEASDAPSAGGGTAHEVTAARPRRSRRRAGTAVLGAVAAIAVLVPLALHSGRPLGSGPTSTVLPGTSSARSSAPGATVGGSASASASPTTSPTGTGTASASPSLTPGLSASAPASAGGPPPIRASVLADNWDTQCGQWFLLTQQPRQVPPPPALQETGAWASALGGIPAGNLRLQITVQGTSDQVVVLNSISVHVASRGVAPKGTGYTPGSGCGAGLDPASYAVDLDAAVPGMRPVPGYVGNGTTSRLHTLPLRVSATDPEVIDVNAGTVDRDVRWWLELTWSSAGRTDVLRIDDHGRPFRTVGLQGDAGYFYDGVRWSPTPAGS